MVGTSLRKLTGPASGPGLRHLKQEGSSWRLRRYDVSSENVTKNSRPCSFIHFVCVGLCGPGISGSTWHFKHCELFNANACVKG